MAVVSAASDVFPFFSNGNVIINFDLSVAVRPFQLHSQILSTHSTFFAANLGPAWSDTGSAYVFLVKNVDGSYILEQQLVESMPRKEDNPLENLDATDFPNATNPSSKSSVTVPHVSTTEPTVALFRQGFGLLYGRPITTSSTVEVGCALSHIEGLLHVCKQLGCVRLLRPYFNTIIVEQRQKIYIAINADPARWMRLAVALKSTSIYTECLIHLAGAWPHWPWKTRVSALSPKLLQLVAAKSKLLDDQCLEINQELLLSTICIGRNASPVACAPEQMETWLLVQTFHDAVAAGIRNMHVRDRQALLRGRFYRRIHAGGECYLSYEQVRRTALDVLPKAAWKDLGRDLSQIKEYAARLVEPLVKNGLMIEPDGHGIGYLTCTEVGPGDIVWEMGEGDVEAE